MKFIYSLLLIVLVFGITTANNIYRCNFNDSNNYCNKISIENKLIGEWNSGERGGAKYSQWEVTVKNNLNFDITQFYIYRDYTLKIRDRKSIWNVQDTGDITNNLILPNYQTSVSANGGSWVFGFILQDSTPANLTLEAISFKN